MTDIQRFELLFKPSRIGEMDIKNRIVMPPMGTAYSSKDSYITERNKSYYEERAKGGVGLIIVEGSCIESRLGMIMDGYLISIDDDRFIPGLSELAQVIQRHGTKVAIQLIHGGGVAKPRAPGFQALTPSSIQLPTGQSRELTVADIAEIVALFAKAAKRAKQAGFDAVEIHGAHRYLIAQFLSPTFNKRQDEYGGELKNRARILIEIIKAVRQSVGEKYPIMCRINGKEFGVEGGTTLEEAQEVAQMAEKSGANAIHVSAWGVRSQIQAASLPFLPGALVPLAEGIKKVVNIPVIAVGRIGPELGERVLQDGKADFIAIGRALIADPELPNKVAQGKLADIRACTACMACRDGLLSVGELRCMVNPALGKEYEHPVKPAEKRKKILIVGGGPAGMEAAMIAASRGHEAILYEKEDRLGGQLVIGAIPPHKGRIEPLTNYLATQVKKLGVQVELGKEITSQVIQELKPDVVVLATGVIPLVPDIPGIDSANVVTAEDVLNGKAVTGERVIVLGGELVGCETAEFLAEKGKKVTITRRGLSMATKVGPSLREGLLDRLGEKGVTMLTGVKYDAITDRGLVITTGEGRKETIEADTVVLATGSKANRKLLTELKGMVSEIHLVGDCVEPRGIREAIDEGFRIACIL